VVARSVTAAFVLGAALCGLSTLAPLLMLEPARRRRAQAPEHAQTGTAGGS
jgi:hypothetical protein